MIKTITTARKINIRYRNKDNDNNVCQKEQQWEKQPQHHETYTILNKQAKMTDYEDGDMSEMARETKQLRK